MSIKAVLTLPVTMDRLNEITDFVESTLLEEGVDESDLYPIHLAVDEVCTNIFSYSKARVVTVMIETTPTDLMVTISDDGFPFNPLTVPTPDLTAGIDEREPGGLGIHLVRNFLDEISYDYQNGKNILRMVRRRVE
jgi:anti-sigma regulatory factor (Ser/Thr protein kinase)